MVLTWKNSLRQLISTFSILVIKRWKKPHHFLFVTHWSHSSHDFKPCLCWELFSLYPLSCSNNSAPKVTIHLTSNWVVGQYLRHNLANKDYWSTYIPHSSHSSGNLSIFVIDTICSQLLNLKAEEDGWSPWMDSFLMVSSVRFTLNIVIPEWLFLPIFFAKATVTCYLH